MTSKMWQTVRMALIIGAALLLAALGGILVTHADGPVLWKQLCPRWYELEYVPEKDGGVNVVCVFQAVEEVER